LRLLRTLGAVEASSRTSIRRNSLDSGGAWNYTLLMGGNPEVLAQIGPSGDYFRLARKSESDHR
jgi:hypothetical protein